MLNFYGSFFTLINDNNNKFKIIIIVIVVIIIRSCGALGSITPRYLTAFLPQINSRYRPSLDVSSYDSCEL